MSVESAARAIADCSHPMAIPRAGLTMRCPFCGAMRLGDGPWALPHLVAQLVRELKPNEEKQP